MPQADVTKLQSAASKMSKSCLTVVASSMDKVDVWKEMVFKYVRELPSMKELAPTIRALMAGLQIASLDGDGCKLLVEEAAV